MLSGVTVRYLAVGMPYFAIKCLAKSLEPSRAAPALPGPTMSSSRPSAMARLSRNSRRPSTSGSSLPATTRSISFDTTASYTASKSVGFIGRLVPKAAVPALPGAMKNWPIRGLWLNFQAIAASRPPLPSSSTLSFSLLIPYCRYCRCFSSCGCAIRGG